MMSGHHINRKTRQRKRVFLMLGIFSLSVLTSYAFSEKGPRLNLLDNSFSVPDILESVKSMAASNEPASEPSNSKPVVKPGSVDAGKGATSEYNADINEDGYVDAFDLIILITDFGKSSTGPS